MIAISEVRGVLPEANPHHAPMVIAHDDRPDPRRRIMADAVAPLVVPVGSGPLPEKLYAVGAEFAGPAELYHAAEKVRDKGFKWWDCYTPYYIHGLDRAMGQRKSFVRPLHLRGRPVRARRRASCSSSITSVWVYPIDTQGKPYFSLPAFVPILDLLMILLSAIMSASSA